MKTTIIPILCAAIAGAFTFGCTATDVGSVEAANTNIAVSNATMAVYIEDYVSQEWVDLGSYPGENCVVRKTAGGCPVSWEQVAEDPEYFLGTSDPAVVADCEARWPMAYTDVPSLWGNVKYDNRAYDCTLETIGGEDPNTAPQSFFPYRVDQEYDASLLTDIPNRGCSPTDEGCMDRCSQQGRARLDIGYAYQTELCSPIYDGMFSWWKPDYLCGGMYSMVPSFGSISSVNPETSEWLTSGGGMEWMDLEEGIETGEFSECWGMAFPHFGGGELAVPEMVFVATVSGATSGTVTFHAKRVSGTGDFVAGFTDESVVGRIRRNVIRNAQGDIALRDRATGAHFWGEPSKIGNAAYGSAYANAEIVRQYERHGEYIAVTDLIPAWPWANNEAASYLDAYSINDGGRIDIPNQKFYIFKP